MILTELLQFITGCAAFALFFLGDWNDWRLRRPALRAAFPLGTVLAAAAAGWEIAARGRFSAAAAVIALLFLAALVYTLFFALPVKDAYAEQGRGREVCRTGVYALCRHPGVLWFIGLYAALALGGMLSARSALCYSLLDLALIVFEDRWVFPAVFDDYESYRRTTPFLIPDRASVRAFIKTVRGGRTDAL